MPPSLDAWKRLHADDDVDTADLLEALREAYKAAPAAYEKTWIPYLATLTWTRRPSDQWYRRGLAAENSLEVLDANRSFAPFLPQTFTLEIASKPKRMKLFDALVASPLLAFVDELVLTGGKLGDAALAALCESAHLAKVSVLRLGDCDIGDAGLRALATCARLATLRTLDLSGNKVTSGGIVALARSPIGANLVELDVSSIELDRKAVEAIARCPKLAVLRLGNTDLGDAGVATLAKHVVGTLVELELVHGDLTVAAAKALADAAKFASLRKLALFDNALDDTAVAALAASKHLVAVTHLDLGKNKFTKTGCAALAASTAFSSLTELSLDSNNVGNDGAAALAASKAFPALALLGLKWAKLTDAGAVALANARANLPALRRLEVKGNKFGKAGMAALDTLAGVRVDR